MANQIIYENNGVLLPPYKPVRRDVEDSIGAVTAVNVNIFSTAVFLVRIVCKSTGVGAYFKWDAAAAGIDDNFDDYLNPGDTKDFEIALDANNARPTQLSFIGDGGTAKVCVMQWVKK